MTRSRRGFVKGAGLVLLGGAAAASLDAERRAERRVEMFGTSASVVALGEAPGEAVEAAFRAMRRVDRLMSRFREGSEVSALNREGSVEASPWTLEAVETGLRFGEESGGAFDVTTGSPGSFRDVSVDDGTVSLRNGARLDLGGVGVGFAVDRAAEELRRRGVRGLVNVGGDVAAVGGRTPAAPWRVGVRDPGGGLLRVAELRGEALATSGNYERSHVLDPRTGEEPRGLASSTAAAGRCVDADALSTAAYVLGAKAGAGFVEELGESLLLTEGGEVSASPGFPSRA